MIYDFDFHIGTLLDGLVQYIMLYKYKCGRYMAKFLIIILVITGIYSYNYSR